MKPSSIFTCQKEIKFKNKKTCQSRFESSVFIWLHLSQLTKRKIEGGQFLPPQNDIFPDNKFFNLILMLC